MTDNLVEERFIPIFLDYFTSSEKKKSGQKIGLEIELIGFHKHTSARLGLNDVSKVFQRFNSEKEWEPVYESGVILEMRKGLSKISLEPGFQLEFSTNPHQDLVDVESELIYFQSVLAELSAKHNWFWLCTGYDPISKPTDIPWNPKIRYGIMRRYLPAFGQSVLRMMPATAGAQVNLDYTDEWDMVKKMRVSFSVSSIVAAIFTNSCVAENQFDIPAIRSKIWNDIDPVRSGYVERVFDADFGYEPYVRHILTVPMLMLKKDGVVEDHAGKDFGKYLTAHADRYEPDDWTTQLSIVFPFARLRNTIEVRTADSGNVAHCMALCAFWKGLLYDDGALEEAYRETHSHDMPLLRNIQATMPKHGLKMTVGMFDMTEKAARFVKLAKNGLTALNPREAHYLDYVDRIVASGQSVSEAMQKKYPDFRKQNALDIFREFNLLFC